MSHPCNKVIIVPIVMVATLLIFTILPFSSALATVVKEITNSIGSKLSDPLDPSDAIYNSNISRVLGVKNLSLAPYRTTDERYFEHGILKNVGNITNNQTFLNTYLADDLVRGKGNGTFETQDGQTISWISSDLGTRNGNQWVYYGIMLFNSTDSKSLSLLNNSLAISKSSYPLMEPEYIWLLK